MRRVLRSPRVLLSGGLLLLMTLAAVFAPYLAPYDPSAQDPLARLEGPSAQHWLGTDHFGADIFSRLIYGARVSLQVGFGAIILAGVVGTLLGMAAAYTGGWTETIVMRLVDLLLTMPPILMALFIVSFLSPSVTNLILVIGCINIAKFARIAHGSTLGLKSLEYVEASKAIGASTLRILRKSILPNIMAPILVQASLGMGHAILMESGLSFLGLGPPPPTPTWGRMIESATRFMHLNVHMVLWPSIAISVTVLALNVLGDALRDGLDPKLKL